MPSIFEKQDLERQLRKQRGETGNGKPDPRRVKELGRASRKASQQPTYRRFPKPARNECDAYGQSIATVKCGKCRKKGHTSQDCTR